MSADLRAIAEAATRGPWEATWWYGSEPKRWCVEADEDIVAEGSQPNMAHIAAWSPDRALAALDVKDRLEDVLAEAEDYRTYSCRDHAAGLHGHLCESLTDARAALDRWEAL